MWFGLSFCFYILSRDVYVERLWLHALIDILYCPPCLHRKHNVPVLKIHTEKCKNTKGAIRNRKSKKNRQYNGQKTEEQTIQWSKEEEQTIQWSKEKGQKAKQQGTKHYTEN